ncbi:mechanosensitive ion channel component [Cytophaga hutchinsonii ATCC 33406]|uniref:Mechanosensitive ion channel component n=2 Tax=Cytophaga hutchinsonii TaxID=985 RepID=A0A6N4SQB3_CYTH3|nr:mechanosensitive ion channel component [Cytophaga hutchinsonii ATCC 33406]
MTNTHMPELAKPEFVSVDHLKSVTDSIISYLPTLAYSLAVLFVGFWLAKRLDKGLAKYFNKRNYDVSLEGFIRSLVSVGLKIIIVLTFAGMIGLPTTSLLAVFGAAGLAVGLALQGSLANFAGGVLILIFKPFKVGDVISTQGETGEVQEIQIFNTILLTPENKTVILANGSVSNGTIVNVTRHGNLRASLRIAIDFSEDLDHVRSIIMGVLQNEPLVLKTPEPSVIVVEYAESAIVLSVRPYANVADFGPMQTAVYEKIRKEFIAHEVKSPEIKRTYVQP